MAESTYELLLADGRRVTWDGADGIDACRRYADAHRGAVVLAWRRPRPAVVAPGVGMRIEDGMPPREERDG